MTPKGKATQLIEQFKSKRLAKLVINEVKEALTEYGDESMQLQNMDSEFRFWDKVESCINDL